MFFNPEKLLTPANFANLLISDATQGAITDATQGAITDATQRREISKLAELASPLAAGKIADAAPEQLTDTRRTCRQCRNLARNGRCLAAGRGELPLTASRYEPFQDRLERCVGYLPTADDPDQRPGNERYPGLHQQLWAMAKEARR